MDNDQPNWHTLAAQLHFEGRAFLKGRYVGAHNGRTLRCVNPANGQHLTEVVWCSGVDVDIAVEAAREAFDSGVWSGLAPLARGRILKRFAALIREHANELALLETQTMGKPISDAITIDVPGAAYCIEWYAEVIDKIGGEVAPTEPRLVGLITREPAGVVAVIVPWNFPLLIASWKFGPALAAGNAVIIKPSEKSPLSAIRLGALAKEAGIPDGVFQVLPGGTDTGKHLALHNDVDCIAFTGSTATGKLIASYAAQSNLKRVWLELGGKSPNIILADCLDLERAAGSAARGIFHNMGARRTAGSRIVIHRDVKDRFLSELLQAVEPYYPGDPLQPNTRMGAIVDRLQFDKVLNYIDSAQQEGANLLYGGNATLQQTQGFFIEPTILDCPRPNLSACRDDEVFGPVLSVITFRDIEEAVRIANDNEYGLAAAVWTANVTTAHQVARRLRVGTVWVNCYDEGEDMNFPCGGVKQSGNSRDKSLHALDKYTAWKSTLIRL